MSLIVIIAVCYIAFTSLVLKILRFVRDKNLVENEYYTDETLDTTGRIALRTEQRIKQIKLSNTRYA